MTGEYVGTSALSEEVRRLSEQIANQPDVTLLVSQIAALQVTAQTLTQEVSSIQSHDSTQDQAITAAAGTANTAAQTANTAQTTANSAQSAAATNTTAIGNLQTAQTSLSNALSAGLATKASNTDLGTTNAAVIAAKATADGAATAASTAQTTATNAGSVASSANSAAANALTALGYNITFRNKLINGKFDVWQRGSTFVGALNVTTFTADRWFTFVAGASTLNVELHAFPVTDTTIPERPQNYLRCIGVTGNNTASYSSLGQRIEGVRTLSGKTVTASFWARSINGNANVYVECIQSFGTGGSPSTSVIATGGLLGLTTAWRRVSVTFIIPSIGSTAALGTGGNDCLQFQIWLDSNTSLASRTPGMSSQTATIDFTEIQLEEGSVATPFEMLPIHITELQCWRYYWQIVGNATGGTQSVLAIGTVFTASLVSRAHRVYPTPMRVQPTIAWAGTVNIQNGGTLSTGAALGTIYASRYHFEADVSAGSNNMTVGYAAMVMLQPNAVASFNAEL